MKRYCQFCGFGTDYLGLKPAHCGKCKKSFEAVAEAIVAQRPAPIATRPSIRVVETEDDEFAERETDFDPNDLTGIDCKIVLPPNSRQRVTVAQIAGGTPIDEPIREIPTTVDRRTLIHDMLPNIEQKPARKPAKRKRR